MRKLNKRILAFTLVFTLLMSLMMFSVNADDDATVVVEQDKTKVVETEVEDEDEDENNGRQNAENRQQFREERKLKEQENGLRNMLAKMLEAGNVDKAKIALLIAEIEALETQTKDIRLALRERIRTMYTSQEWRELEAVKVTFEAADPTITVLDPDSIITNDAMIKFDTPPVIKEGRTLIPVRALTEAFSATVKWEPELQKVTISKDDKVIELFIGKNKVYLNGVEQEIDTYARIMNNRTMVPLRFITEALGLKVEWQEKDKTIEVVDESLLD